jgi:hypothetical protein
MQRYRELLERAVLGCMGTTLQAQMKTHLADGSHRILLFLGQDRGCLACRPAFRFRYA